MEEALNRAQAAALDKRYGEAGGICSDILAKQPDYPPAVALSGLVAMQAGDHTRAVELLEKAIGLDPNIPACYGNLCTLYRMSYRLDDALRVGKESVRLSPESAAYLVNLSLLFTDLEDHERAVSCLLRAIGHDGKHADAHLALAQELLASGDLAAGWIEYEWRNETALCKEQFPNIKSAQWNGMRLPKGRILLACDQGFGDTIQFARYVPMVQERCEQVVLGCSTELLPLLKRMPGVEAYNRWGDLPGHAAHCRISSLPYIFGTTLETIPPAVPYLHPDPAKVAAWSEWLERLLPKGALRVGLAWSGRKTHPNDKRRSIALEQLLPLAQTAGCAFVSLQKPFPVGDLPHMQAFPGMVDLSERLTDFDETGALIKNLDLVVTVDTAIGHLSGALGKPAWIMIPHAADWRWLMGRQDSPWYPTMRLLRQPSPGDWTAVIAEAANMLDKANRGV